MKRRRNEGGQNQTEERFEDHVSDREKPDVIMA